jgi:hypothetical protein
MYIEDMTSLSVRPIHKLGFTNPIGANPCDTGYSHISEDEYDSDDTDKSCGESDCESDTCTDTTSEVSECDSRSNTAPDRFRTRANKSMTSVIFKSILQEEEFLPE